ncbi:hypothetical protein HRbin30_00913 [bacterium HR30]|nr:hypothetical protein HRbin30_00913 [bacterium HR30]
MGLLACVLTLSMSLWRFSSFPAGVCCMDTAENMRLFYRTENFHWSFLFLESRAPMGQGFDFLPIYFLNLVFKNFYGERVVGLLSHLLLVLGASALLPRRGFLVGLALVAVWPAFLWPSRHMQGTSLLLGELGLIGCLMALRRSFSWKAALGAVGCLSYLSWAYLPIRVVYVFPLLFLWRQPKRALVVYGLFSVPLFLTLVVLPWYVRQPVQWRLLPGRVVHGEYRIPSLSDLVASLRSFVDPRAGVTSTASLRGVQALPWSAIPFVLWGSLRGPFGVTGLVATAPDVFSSGTAGRSHRSMATPLPLAFAAASAPSNAVFAGIVATEAIGRWVWLNFTARPLLFRWHGGYEGLFPCEHVIPTPEWCSS